MEAQEGCRIDCGWEAVGSLAERLPEERARVCAMAERALREEARGDSEGARAAWMAVLELEPGHLPGLYRLGGLLAAAGEKERALAIFSEAVARHPTDAGSRVLLANTLLKMGEFARAREELERALELEANLRAAHAGLALVLPRLGEAELGGLHGRLAFAGGSPVEVKFRGEGRPIRVLELVSTRGGNVRIQSFLSDRVFERYLVAAEFFDLEWALPEHDLIVNAIGDADVAGEALDGAARLMAQTSAPVINRPEAVRATGRAEMARRLAAIPGVRTARMASFARSALAGPEAGQLLADRGFGFPVLLRALGFHGGEHFLRVDSAEGLAAALGSLPGEAVLAIEYLDAFWADGKARKFRAMSVGGSLYPLHCAVSRHWKIHYFSAEMVDSEENRGEDAAFLADMRGVLGREAMGALEAVAAAVGLDYGGIDFGLSRAGELLVFEANATMAILPPGPEAKWDYRRPAVERVCGAVHGMLASRGLGRGEAGCLREG